MPKESMIDWLLKIIISFITTIPLHRHHPLISFNYSDSIEGRDSRFCILKFHQLNPIT